MTAPSGLASRPCRSLFRFVLTCTVPSVCADAHVPRAGLAFLVAVSTEFRPFPEHLIFIFVFLLNQTRNPPRIHKPFGLSGLCCFLLLELCCSCQCFCCCFRPRRGVTMHEGREKPYMVPYQMSRRPVSSHHLPEEACMKGRKETQAAVATRSPKAEIIPKATAELALGKRNMTKIANINTDTAWPSSTRKGTAQHSSSQALRQQRQQPESNKYRCRHYHYHKRSRISTQIEKELQWQQSR